MRRPLSTANRRRSQRSAAAKVKIIGGVFEGTVGRLVQTSSEPDQTVVETKVAGRLIWLFVEPKHIEPLAKARSVGPHFRAKSVRKTGRAIR